MSITCREDYVTYCDQNPHQVHKPRPHLLSGMTADQLLVFVEQHAQQISDILSSVSKAPGDLFLSQPTPSEQVDWLTTRFLPTDHIFDINDLAQEVFPDASIIAEERRQAA